MQQICKSVLDDLQMCRNVWRCAWTLLQLTSQQFGLAVDKLWFSFCAVALARVVQDLHKHALVPS